jgi:low affinity Fe/Cu permease
MAAARGTGSSLAFSLAVLLVLGWAATGPLFAYSETWQLVINTGTTIVTFLMVFLIQHAQNKDSTAIHMKLNELLAAQTGASNHLIAAEELDEYTLQLLRRHYRELVDLSVQTGDVAESHSVEEALRRHRDKIDDADD